MKKIIFSVIIVGMLGWAIYDFVLSNDSSDGARGDVGTSVGEVAPDFELTTLNGESVQLSDFRGQRVFVNFWATWCPPCRAEMPDMQKLYDDNDVEVLAVNLTSTEKSEDDVIEFIEDDFGFTFPVLMDEEAEVSSLYQVQAYPTSYLIDSEGRIQKVALGSMNYDQMVQEVEKMK